MDLPFIEGVGLRDFSKISINEFGAYAAFRDFLRQSFLDMDEASRKGAVTVTGAAIGLVGATLVAVYGPALATAVAQSAPAAPSGASSTP